MARAALQLGVRELAESASVSPTTITRLERGETLFPRTIEALRAALEAAGVEFIAENGGGPGVRLASPRTGPNLSGRATCAAAPEPRSIGPEDEARGGHEVPATRPGPTVPGVGRPGSKRRTGG
jgi:transcriptional regulator with XRE-family HTH domain